MSKFREGSYVYIKDFSYCELIEPNDYHYGREGESVNKYDSPWNGDYTAVQLKVKVNDCTYCNPDNDRNLNLVLKNTSTGKFYRTCDKLVISVNDVTESSTSSSITDGNEFLLLLR